MLAEEVVGFKEVFWLHVKTGRLPNNPTYAPSQEDEYIDHE